VQRAGAPIDNLSGKFCCRSAAEAAKGNERFNSWLPLLIANGRYRGSGSPLVSRPSSIATMLSSAKQVMNAVTRLKLPPNAPTRSPATSGPKLVMIRALPVQKPTPV